MPKTRRVGSGDNIIYVLLLMYLGVVLVRYIPRGAFTHNHYIYCCFLVCVVWLVSIRLRFVENRQRHFLYAIAFLLIIFHLIQICKYSLFEGYDAAERLMWYLYYVPITLLPLISLCLSVMTGRSAREKMPLWLNALFIPALVQIVLFVTNDYHQLVFSFNEGFANWNTDYKRQVLFYINQIWFYFLVIASFFIILKKSFRRSSKISSFAGVVVAVFHLCLYVALFVNPSENLKVFGEVPITMPVLYNMTFILFWESMIHLKLIPSNYGYYDIFDIADISAILTDEDGKIVKRSATEVYGIPEEIRINPVNQPVYLDEDKKIYSRNVMGGRIFWEEDVSAINNLNRDLQEKGESIKDGNALLIEEARVKAERAKLHVENDIYDEIAVYMRPHLDIIEKCLEGADDLPEEEFRKRLYLSCFEATFVKRGSNLILLTKSKTPIPRGDYKIAVSELFTYAGLSGAQVSGGVMITGDRNLSDDRMLIAFKAVEKLLYAAFGCKCKARITFDNGEKLVLRASYETDDKYRPTIIEKAQKLAGDVDYFADTQVSVGDDGFVYVLSDIYGEGA